MTWDMMLNVEKCKVMHFGKSNPKAVYWITDDSGNKKYIEKNNLEIDLGVNKMAMETKSLSFILYF